ncbi:uncharacterized protein LOC131540336 isoform X7 [Onychostoma macrolepis]|uniref:uncharacterized protein LOC131540336 isoform X7 n=1 Tax=Onychostoma macrolepis TaxID=369639 RepID=UPI00272CA1E1|nr:uncharacterized protein LOC131540336 isoform X7 [Onychostoma macrolepis]XP_058631001.1 uncharacterized protein LOC131540336 isoform X7 [Onychostoma macrolepis]
MVTDEGNFRAWKLFFFHRNREKITGMRRTAAPEARSVTAASSLRRGHAGTPPLLCSVPQCWMKTIVLVPSSSSGTTPHPPHQPTSSNKTYTYLSSLKISQGSLSSTNQLMKTLYVS